MAVPSILVPKQWECGTLQENMGIEEVSAKPFLLI
jgi:hypothetical protein